VHCGYERDKNTKFFHRVANSNRKYNSIENLVINGDISSSLVEIMEIQGSLDCAFLHVDSFFMKSSHYG
jgi:hypothetical protein